MFLSVIIVQDVELLSVSLLSSRDNLDVQIVGGHLKLLRVAQRHKF